MRRMEKESKKLGVLPKDHTGSFNELTYTALMIIYAYLNDELILIVIHGKQGYGKSTLASIVSAQCYGVIQKMNQDEELTNQLKGQSLSKQRRIRIKWLNNCIDNDESFTYNWDKTWEYFVFRPEDFITQAMGIKQKKPLCVVDDAGMWLNTMDYQNPFVRAVGKFFEVARTKYGAIVFTCSDLKQIFTKIRNMPHVYTIRVIKESGRSGASSNPDRRIGIIHEGWESEDMKKSGRSVLLFDGFVAEMPDNFFNKYNPKRTLLADEGTRKMFEEFEKLT